MSARESKIQVRTPDRRHYATRFAMTIALYAIGIGSAGFLAAKGTEAIVGTGLSALNARVFETSSIQSPDHTGIKETARGRKVAHVAPTAHLKSHSVEQFAVLDPNRAALLSNEPVSVEN